MFSRVARQAVRQATSRVQKQTGNYCYNATRAFSVQDFPEASSGAKQLKTSFELPDPDNGKKNYQLTKIVATIGPTSEQLEPLQKVVQAGMKIMRLNFSHATTDEVELRMENLALSQDKLEYQGKVNQLQDVRATLLDTRGPEIRTGKLKNDDSGHETVTLEKGGTINLQTSTQYEEEGSTATDLFINYSKLNECMAPGMKVLLDDGVVILTVVSVETGKENGIVTCTIDNTGEIRSRAGVNLPMAETDLPAMSEKDKTDIRYGLTIDVDYVAASFIQNADGVREIRSYMETCAKEMGWEASRPLPKIISKIESASALKHFDEILSESDGIMVARGDLGVEIPIQQVTNAQKEMVAACNAVGKPVIVATQMLESMAKNPRPTRAEVADVTNAVYDGADAVMTSGETAKGKYPDETIKMMNDIILSAEQYSSSGSLGSLYVNHGGDRSLYVGERDMDTAIAKAAVTASLARGSKAILVLADSPAEQHLPSLVAAFRPNCPIVSFCSDSKMARQQILHRAIYPVIGLSDVAITDKPAAAMEEAKNMGYVESGDSVVIVYVDSKFGKCANFTIACVPETF